MWAKRKILRRALILGLGLILSLSPAGCRRGLREDQIRIVPVERAASPSERTTGLSTPETSVRSTAQLPTTKPSGPQGQISPTTEILPASALGGSALSTLPDSSPLCSAGNLLLPGQFTLGGNEDRLRRLQAAVIQYCESQGLQTADLALAFRDLTSGDYLGLDDRASFYAASLIKVPAVMYSYDRAAEGLVDLDQTELIVKRDELWEAGSGAVTAAEDGTRFSLRQLLSEMIISSDNTASQMVFDFWTGKAPERWLVYGIDRNYGLSYDQDQGINCRQAINLLCRLYGQAEHYQTLLSDLCQTLSAPLGASYLPYRVAHKYGQFNGCLHDMGIVYSEQPFAYCILSSNVPGAAEHLGRLAELMAQIDQLSTAETPEPEPEPAATNTPAP